MAEGLYSGTGVPPTVSDRRESVTDCARDKRRGVGEIAARGYVSLRRDHTLCPSTSTLFTSRRGFEWDKRSPQWRLVRAMVRPRFTVSVAIGALVVAQGCARNPRPRQPTPRVSRAEAVSFTITAYCAGRITAAGTRVTEGVVAADPHVLPLGTVIRLAGLDARYNGTYTVMDTGLRVRGRRLDLYLHDCAEAVRFGHRSGRVSIAR
jgi:3D (Asp-Asp-Asp) domain-containing protein